MLKNKIALIIVRIKAQAYGVRSHIPTQHAVDVMILRRTKIIRGEIVAGGKAVIVAGHQTVIHPHVPTAAGVDAVGVLGRTRRRRENLDPPDGQAIATARVDVEIAAIANRDAFNQNTPASGQK